MSENQQQWNENEEAQMPLGVGGEASAEPGSGTGKSFKINSSWLLLAGVFAAGIALVFALGKQGGPRAASAEQLSKDAQFEAALGELANKAGKKGASSMDTDALVELFKTNTPKKHETIAGNPFELPQKKVVETKVPEAVVVKQVEDPVEAQRLLRIAEALKAMKVTSIMYAKERSAALIGKDFVQVGSKIGEFTVAAIENDRVILETGGEKYQLKLAQPGTKN